MSAIIMIPARYASSRYPAKALAPLRGVTGVSKPLVVRAWEAARAVKGVDATFVATDDDRIADVVRAAGGAVVMTDPEARNGTERCADALGRLGLDPTPDVVINLQGDSPLTPPWFVEALLQAMAADPMLEAATPVIRCDGAALERLRADRRQGRVGGTTAVGRPNGDALYFSKEVVPFTAADYAPEAPTPVLHHVGLYAYRPTALAAYMAAGVSELEELEGLEQLRFLASGRRMRLVEVEARGRVFWELNNPSDTELVESGLAAAGVI